MIGSSQRSAAGWGASMALHAALFLVGGLILFHAPVFGVQEAPYSAELELVASTETPDPPTPVTKQEETPPAPAPPPVIADSQENEADEMTMPVPIPAPRLSQPVEIAQPTPHAPQPKRHAIAPAKTAPQKSQAPSGGQKGALQAQPDYLRNPPPVYPEQARMEHRQGVVLLKVAVSSMGEPTSVTLARSSGYADFDDSALRAVRRWKFRPASAGGMPIPSTVGIPVDFELR